MQPHSRLTSSPSRYGIHPKSILGHAYFGFWMVDNRFGQGKYWSINGGIIYATVLTYGIIGNRVETLNNGYVSGRTLALFREVFPL